MIKLCIFDLDGTICDTLTSLWYCGNQALADCGYAPLPREQYRYMVGDGTAALMERLLSSSGDTSYTHYLEILSSYKKHFQEGCTYQVKPYDGIPELLDYLKHHHIACAVLSNKPHEQANKIVTEIFGNHCFSIILGQRENIPKKPSPEGVYEILNHQQIKKEECMYFGDTNTDMQTGKNAGLYTIGVLWGFRDQKELEENGADAVILHPMDAISLLD